MAVTSMYGFCMGFMVRHWGWIGRYKNSAIEIKGNIQV